MVPIRDPPSNKTEWIEKIKHKNYIQQEIERMSGNLSTGRLRPRQVHCSKG